MDEIGVLEVLSRRILGAAPQVGAGRFIKTPISPHVEHYFKRGDLCVSTIVLRHIGLCYSSLKDVQSWSFLVYFSRQLTLLLNPP